MLAYLFFHEALADADRGAYEEGLRDFHSALRAAGVSGFLASRTYRIGDGYCDWYLVENSAALDPLNDAAVSGARSSFHAGVARYATNGAGKLMKLVAGVQDPEARFEIRFSKPRDLPYSELYSRLRPWTDRRDVSLWRRMMVLGPPPEFYLVAQTEEELPPELTPAVFRREPV